MNITFSIDENTLRKARQVAANMGKSLNELIREDLERLARQQQRDDGFKEFKELTGQGDSRGWKFDRDELHERT